MAASFFNYQPPEHDLPGGEGVRQQRARSATLRAFRDISTCYFRDEAGAHSWSDILLFAIITGIAAWPIFLAIEASIQLLR